MKKFAIAFLLLSAAAFAQSDIYAAGVSFNNAATPAIAGSALYAHSVNDGSGTYAFTVIDALPNTLKPFTVTTNVSAGVAQKAFTIGKVPIYIPTSAGVSFNGQNTGWSWSTGAMGSVAFKKGSNWRLFPNVRILKSSVSNGTGYQAVVGLFIGFSR